MAIEFDEAQLSNIQNVGRQLFADDHDPANFAYKRILIRPAIKWGRIIIYMTMLTLFPLTAWVICWAFELTMAAQIAVPTSVLILYMGFTAKKAMIGCIHLYQHFAPDTVRNRCRFEPSCSQYMILAIERYGAFRGLQKGIGRLKRCNIHNGGVDYP